MKTDIFLSKKVLENPFLTDEGFLAYTALRTKWYFSNHHFQEDIIHYEYMLWILSGKETHTNKFLQKMKTGLHNLVDIGLIDLKKEHINKALLQFNDSYFFKSKDSDMNAGQVENYTTIQLAEVHKIMLSSEKYKDKLLRYFTIKIGSIYRGNPKLPAPGNEGYYCMNNVGSMPISYCARLAQIKEKAAMHYDHWLEENGLLIILRSNSKILDDYYGKIVNGFPNCYARPEHISELKDYYTQREEHISNSSVVQISKLANQNRSRKQSFNAYLKKKSYDPLKVARYFNDRIDTLRKINRKILDTDKNNNNNQDCYYSNLEEIDSLNFLLSDMCWQMFLDGDIDFGICQESYAS